MSERPRDLSARFQLVKAALDAEPVAVAILRYPELRYLYTNAEMRRLAGRDLTGALHTDAWPIDMVEKLTRVFRRVARTGEPWIERDAPWDLPRSPGAPAEQIFLTYEVSRISIGDGSFLLTTVTETTDEVVARQQRDSLARRMREVLDCVTDAVFAIDREWCFSYANARAAQLCGRRPDELIGAEVWGVLPDAEGTAFQATCREVMAGGDPVRLVTHDGPFASVVEARIHPAEDGIVVYAVDTGRTSEGADALVESREREIRFSEQARFSDTLVRIGADINSALDFDSIMGRTVGAASQAVRADNAAAFMLDVDRWTATHTYGDAELDPGDRVPREMLRHAEAALLSKATVVIDNAASDERSDPQQARKHSIGSMCVVPLQRGDEVFGVLVFNRLGIPRPFSEAERDFLSKLGHHVSLAVENAWLLERERDAAHYNAVLNEIDAVIAATLDTDDMLEGMLGRTAGLLGADSAVAALIHEREWRASHVIGELKGVRAGRKLSADILPQAKMALHDERIIAIDDTDGDSRVNPAFTADNRIASTVVVPLRRGSERFGVLLFNRHERPRPFDEMQLDFCAKLGVHVSLAMQNARLYESQRHIADTLQEALLVLPDSVEGLEFAHEYRSASEVTRVGGDFYDIFQIDEHTAGMVIGDVSGKGLDAAVVTSLARNTIRAYSAERMAVCSVVERASDVVLSSTDVWTFMSVFYAVLDFDAGVISYCNAGHPSPLLIDRSGGVVPLPQTAAIAGAFHGAEYGQGHATFEVGDTLLLYTDGLIEARSKAGLYGESRLLDAVRSCHEQPPEGIIEHVLRDVDAHSDQRLDDDLAIICARIVRPRAY